MCRGVVFIAQERGPKSNLHFRLGCNWKESRRGATAGPGCRMALTLCRARRVTSGASPQVPLPFLGIWKPSPRHFGVGKGGCAAPAQHHFGSLGVNFTLAGMSLRQRVPQCPQPLLPAPAICTLCYFCEGCTVDEGGEDTQSAGVEAGGGASWD